MPTLQTYTYTTRRRKQLQADAQTQQLAALHEPVFAQLHATIVGNTTTHSTPNSPQSTADAIEQFAQLSELLQDTTQSPAQAKTAAEIMTGKSVEVAQVTPTVQSERLLDVYA